MSVIMDLCEATESAWSSSSVYTRRPKPKIHPGEDLLVLSVAHHRTRIAGVPSYFGAGIDNGTLIPKITRGDRVLAATIRDYYSKKIMMLVLKGIRLTPYRKSLNEFLNGTEVDGVDEEMLPLVAKLPEFHEYDCEYDNIRISLTSVPHESVPFPSECEKTLTPMKHLKVRIKSGNLDEYWLRDQSTNQGYKIKLVDSPVNPLLHLWEREFAEPTVKISGIRSLNYPDGFGYYLLTKWKVV